MKLCIALDMPSSSENLKLAEKLKKFDIWLKVGLRSYIRDSSSFLEDLKSINPDFKIFLDLKLYDIPNTMADAAEEICKLPVDMFNIHASAGEEAMREVTNRIGGMEKKPLVLAVTALTSFDQESFRKIYNRPLEEAAIDFAKMAYRNSLDGVVCSVYESMRIKRETSPNFITLTPGIRPFQENSDDQKRVADIASAKRAKADFIVVGRPVYRAENPAAAVEKILTNIEN